MSNGRTVIITGAANGIGRATALELAADGWRVIVADIDGDAASKVAMSIEAQATTKQAASAVALDVSSEDAVNAYFAELQASDLSLIHISEPTRPY